MNDNFRNSSLWGQRTWTYTARFKAPDNLLAPTGQSATSVLLVFDGVKMGARVVLNGAPLGTVEDQFLRYTFEVSSALGAENTLEVIFDQDIDVKGRFMACSGGWDWAPYTTTYNCLGTKVFTLGLWKDVYLVPIAPGTAALLHVVPHIRYTGPYPTTPLTQATASPFALNVTLFTWAPTPVSVLPRVVGAWAPGTSVQGAPRLVPAGEGRVGVSLTATNVALWWPNGLGAQPLYDLNATLSFPGAEGAAAVSALRRVGFRYAVLVTGNDTDPAYVEAAAHQDGSAPKGGMTTFIFRVNGVPVFAKGANMVPMEELEGRASAAALYYLVESAARAGFTILRNWGGGIFQYDAWYDALDEFGILCYQDLM